MMYDFLRDLLLLLTPSYNVSLFLTTVFMASSWNTFELFNGELLDISESFNVIIKLYLKEYITYDMFKAELASKNIPYLNQEYYEHLVDTYCAQLKNVTRISMDVYPELTNKDYQNKYEELLWCSIRKSFIDYIISVTPPKDIDNFVAWIFLNILIFFFRKSEEPAQHLIKNTSLFDILNTFKDQIINWIAALIRFFCGF